MAKAKKEKTETKPAANEPVAPKKAPARKAPAKAKAKSDAQPAGMPLIDTSLAAQTAARLVKNRDLLGGSKATGSQPESSSFKQLKESLLKPSVQGPGGLLSPQLQNKKFNQGFGGRNQVGHNQTFGADVNRSGVPRRTSGG